MITNNRRILTTLLVLALTCPYLLFGQNVPDTVPKCSELVFSDVRYVPESDDYVGTEIVLRVCRNQQAVNGEWNEYEGGHTPAKTRLTGRRAGSVVRLSGSNSEGKASLIGNLKGERLTGRLLWYIGRNQQEKKLDLMRKQIPSASASQIVPLCELQTKLAQGEHRNVRVEGVYLSGIEG